MSQMTVEELNDLIRREFPQSKAILETISPRRCRVRIPINSSHLRPGGTVSGPTMMSLADNAMYLALLAEIGPVLLAVTTNLVQTPCSMCLGCPHSLKPGLGLISKECVSQPPCRVDEF